jgi:hypothetical protein
MIDNDSKQVDVVKQTVTAEISGAIKDTLFLSNGYYQQPPNPPVESINFIISTLEQLYEQDAFEVIRDDHFLNNIFDGIVTLVDMYPPTLYGYARESGDSQTFNENLRNRYGEFVSIVNDCLSFVSVLRGFDQLRKCGSGTRFSIATKSDPSIDTNMTLRRIESHSKGYRIYPREKLGPFDLLSLASLNVISDN